MHSFRDANLLGRGGGPHCCTTIDPVRDAVDAFPTLAGRASPPALPSPSTINSLSESQHFHLPYILKVMEFDGSLTAYFLEM